METGLSGKVAVVTGGARDVGGEVCRSLAAEGARVVVNYNSSRDEADRRTRLRERPPPFIERIVAVAFVLLVGWFRLSRIEF